MKNIYIIAGEDIVLKEDKIKNIRKDKEEWNYKKIIIENSRADTVSSVLGESFMYLMTMDMFNINPKILNVVVESAKVAVEILNETIDCVGENILIIDIRSNDLRSLTSNAVYKKNTSRIELEKCAKLEEKNRNSTIEEIKDMFDKNNIKFITKVDEDICANYMYDNSEYSYTYIRQQIEQLKYFSDEILSREDVYEFITESFNGNYYVLINKMFNSKTKIELMQLLDSNFLTFNKSDYISFFNIFLYTIKDYLRYSNGVRCKNGSNFYQFKNSKIKINEASKFISEISNLNFICRSTSREVKEEFLMILWKYIDEK